MLLYYSDFLSAHRACAVARHLAAPVEFNFLDAARGEQRGPVHLALNPNGKVPTLVDGETILWESDAVICHLARRMGSSLWPSDPALQVEIIRWFSWSAQHLNRAGGALYFEHTVRPRFGMGPPDAQTVEEETANFRRYAAILSDHLTGRAWLVGEAMTVADFTVAMCLPFAEAAHIPVNDFPEVRRWHDALSAAVPVWREGFPPR